MADQMGVTPPPPPMAAAAPAAMGNTSGTPGAVLPPELQGWSWAGFLMGWIWSIAHGAWLGLVLCLLLSGIGSIIQGVKGNEWAWQGRKWESIQQFKDTERVWVKWGVIVVIAMVILVVLMWGAIAALIFGAAAAGAGAGTSS